MKINFSYDTVTKEWSLDGMTDVDTTKLREFCFYVYNYGPPSLSISFSDDNDSDKVRKVTYVSASAGNLEKKNENLSDIVKRIMEIKE